MANAFTNFLSQTLTTTTQLKDYQHASRLYVDDYFRLAPKSGFLYYIVFNINRNNNPIIEQFLDKNGPELGLLVKTVDLPKYRISTETINQYNKKTIVQSRIEYQPINMVFHDDHNNTTIGMWKSYYNYYFVDGKNLSGLSIPASYGDTKYKKIGTNIDESTAYGMNNGQTDPFFRSIEIYQLNRQQFTAFILVNPVITDFNHDRLDQSTSKLLENSMSVQFETVLYGTGKIKRDLPTGFATIHYDNTPGPLSVFGGGNNSILGQGGLISGIGEVLGGKGDTSPLGLFKTARGATALLKNAKNISKASILSEGYGILDKVARTGKLPDILTGKSPAGLALATLPGENPTSAVPRSQQAGGSGFSLGGLTAGLPSLGSITEKISGAIKGLLPAGAGLGLAALTNARAEKASLFQSLSDQIEKNRALRDELTVKLTAADGDPEQIEAIYAEFDALDYTDPDKLQASLESLQDDDLVLGGLEDVAQFAESRTDFEEVQISDAEIFGEEDDLNIGQANIYPQDDEDDSTTTYYA